MLKQIKWKPEQITVLVLLIAPLVIVGLLRLGLLLVVVDFEGVMGLLYQAVSILLMAGFWVVAACYLLDNPKAITVEFKDVEET